MTGGITVMNDIRYKPRRGRVRRASPEMAAYLRQIAADNAVEHDRLKRNLIRAIREELTERQKQVLMLHYVEEMTINQVAEKLGVYPSTVYRTLHRGEDRLRRCLRYGAAEYLKSMYD